jgi:uncharacterized protein YaaN involved in tellurite resistance
MDYQLTQEFVFNTINEIESNQNKDRKKKEAEIKLLEDKVKNLKKSLV